MASKTSKGLAPSRARRPGHGCSRPWVYRFMGVATHGSLSLRHRRFAAAVASSPAFVRGPVLRPPCSRHRPPCNGRPVRRSHTARVLHAAPSRRRAPHRGRSERRPLCAFARSRPSWRSQRALRQTELAKRAEVGIMSVSRGETGQPLQLATVRKLAEALGVTPAELQRHPPAD